MRVHDTSANKSGAAPAPGPTNRPAPAGRRDPRQRQGIVGGLRIVGEVHSRDDLLIAGVVTGTVFLPECALHIAASAEVKADLTARVIEVEGRVSGRLVASERIAIRSSSNVTGDVLAPRIQIDEGCKFKGSVQMRDPDIKHEAPVHSGPAANE